MTTEQSKNDLSPQASEDEDDCSSGEEEGLLSNEGRRRRFIIERKSEASESSTESSSQSKRPRLDTGTHQQQHNIRRIAYDRRPPGRRRRNNHQNSHHSQQHHNDTRPNFVYNSNLRQIPLVNYPSMMVNEKGQELMQRPPAPTLPPPQQPSPPQVSSRAPIVYINPKFIKKFIIKSIELANINQNTANDGSLEESTSAKFRMVNKKKVDASKVTSNMIDEVDLKTSSIESLRAASKMAIIRLVTECIEDDSKRNELLNKTLVSKLIEGLCNQYK